MRELLSMRKIQYARIFALLIGISIIHMLLTKEGVLYHVLFRMLYLLPIIYAALIAGKKGGLRTSFISTVLFLPHFFFDNTDTQFYAGNFVAIIVFNLTGLGIGTYRDSIEKSYATVQQQKYQTTKKKDGSHILFYLDESSLNLIAANWLLKILGDKPNTFVNMLVTINEDVEDFFESSEEAESHVQKTRTTSESILIQTKKALVEGGIPEEHIQTNLMKSSRKSRGSEDVLQELQSGNYDFVLVGRHNMSKAQEFLFGDMAVCLMRDSPVPVMVVKGAPD